MSEVEAGSPAASVLGRIVSLWALVGAGLLVAIVLINVWAVVGGFVGVPFAGDFELTEMLTAIAVFTFLPYCQLTGQNVSADIFTQRMNRRSIAILSALGSLIALVFAAVLLWRMSLGLADQRAYSYATTILQIPTWWAFVPILVSIAMLFVAAIATLRHEISEAR